MLKSAHLILRRKKSGSYLGACLGVLGDLRHWRGCHLEVDI